MRAKHSEGPLGNGPSQDCEPGVCERQAAATAYDALRAEEHR